MASPAVDPFFWFRGEEGRPLPSATVTSTRVIVCGLAS